MKNIKRENLIILIFPAILMITIAHVIIGGPNSNHFRSSWLPECESIEDVVFPIDRYGFPNQEVILINGKIYDLENLSKRTHELSENNRLKDTLKISRQEIGDVLELYFAQGLIYNVWCLDENSAGDLIEYKELYPKKRDEDEGCMTTKLKKYTFKNISENPSHIRFKFLICANEECPENDKSYDDKDYTYEFDIFIIQ